MHHQSRGLHRLLEWPWVYERFQRLMGADAARRRFVSQFLRPGSGVELLDVGCGTGSLIEYLDRGVRYTGFDVNERYIDSARTRYGGRGTFYCAAVGREPEDLRNREFDVICAKAILHHLDDDDVSGLLDQARSSLRDGGVFVSIDPVILESGPVVARLLVSMDRGRYVRTASAYRRLVASRFSRIEEHVVTDMLSVPYAHYVLRASA